MSCPEDRANCSGSQSIDVPSGPYPKVLGCRVHGKMWIYIYIFTIIYLMYIYTPLAGFFIEMISKTRHYTLFVFPNDAGYAAALWTSPCSSAASAGCCRRPKMGVLVQRTTSRREVRSVCSVSARMELDAATSCCRVGQGDATFPCRRWSQWLRKYLRTK